jgi:hypothetical protein
VKSRAKLLLPVLAFCWVPAHASTIFYSDSGTFSGSTPSSVFSAANEAWTIAFQVDNNPIVSKVSGAMSGNFDVAFSNFSYSLNGSPVVIMPTDIRFFGIGAQGGFEVCFSTFIIGTGCDNGLGATGAQLYTGPGTAPTMLTGTFPSTEFDVFVGSPSTPFIQATSVLQAVPEPSTLLMLAPGLFALGIRRLYWHRCDP